MKNKLLLSIMIIIVYMITTYNFFGFIYPLEVSALGLEDLKPIVNPIDQDDANIFYPDKDKYPNLFYYYQARVKNLPGYLNQWETIYYANIKNDMASTTEGGYPHYGHAQYLPTAYTGDGLKGFNFDVMRKVKKNVTNTTVGTNTSIDYYINRLLPQGFPNFKDRKVTMSSGIRTVHPQGSGHFINKYQDVTGAKRGEWRYLGYGNTFQTIGNPYFPPDYPPSATTKFHQRNWQKYPWNYTFGIEKNEKYNDILSDDGMKNMLLFMDAYDLDMLISSEAPDNLLKTELLTAKVNPKMNPNTGVRDTPREAMARVLTQYFAINAVATDYTAGMITGVHGAGGKNYMSWDIPAKVAPEMINIKVASPYTFINNIGGYWNSGSAINEDGVNVNRIEIYEVDPTNIYDKTKPYVTPKLLDGKQLTTVTLTPTPDLNEINATLTAGKTYLFRSYVRYGNWHPNVTKQRDTKTSIRVNRIITFNKETDPAFTITGGDYAIGDEFTNIPYKGTPIDAVMKANTTQRHEWVYTVPQQFNGEPVTSMKFQVELAGKVLNPVTATTRSYPNDNVLTGVDDVSYINIKVDASMPNLTVASPTSNVLNNAGVKMTNVKIFEKDTATGEMTEVTISDTKDAKGFNGYLSKLKKYYVRTFVYNNPNVTTLATATSATADMKFLYNGQSTAGWAEGNTKVDSPIFKADMRYDLTGGGLYPGLAIPVGKTKMMEYELNTKDKIGATAPTFIKIDIKITNGVNCLAIDNTNLTDDSTSIVLGLDPPPFPNIRVASNSYQFNDNTNGVRKGIEVTLKGSTTVLNSLTAKLTPGKTYTFKTPVRYFPYSKDGKGTMLDNFIELNREYTAKVGTDFNAPLKLLSQLVAKGNDINGVRILPNTDSAVITEDVTIPLDYNTNFTYSVKLSGKHLNRDNSIESADGLQDDASSVTFQIGAGANLMVDRVEVFKMNTTVPLNPATDNLKVGDTYTFKVFMRYLNPATPLAQTVSSGILSDFEISGENPDFVPIGSYNGSKAKLISKNFPASKMVHNNVSVYEFTQKITQDMGAYIYAKGRVPSTYIADNTNPDDDEEIERFNIDYNDLMVRDVKFLYSGSLTDTLTPNKLHSLKFRIGKNAGTKATTNVRAYYQVVDAFNQPIKSGYVTGNKTLNVAGDYQDFTIDNLQTGTGEMTATIEIDPPGGTVYHYPRGENDVRTNDELRQAITSGFLDLSVKDFKVTPIKVDLAPSTALAPRTVTFNFKVTNSNKTKSSIGNGTTDIALVIRRNGSVITDPNTGKPIISYLVLPPDIDAGFSISVPNYQLNWGTNTFEIEINPYRTTVEYSTSATNAYTNNKATASTIVSQNIPLNEVCQLGMTTVKTNSWEETYYMMRRTGTKQEYDCSYTTKDGSYVNRTCYYCDPDDYEYWTEDWSYQERFAVSAFYLRSQWTIDKYGGDGWINILGNPSAGKVRAGSGFEVRIQTTYTTSRTDSNLPKTYRKDMCNYQTRNPGVSTLSNIDYLKLTIPEFKDAGGNQITYTMYPTSTWGSWFGNTKEFQFPLRSAFGIENNRKVYVNENAKPGSKINFRIITDIFEPYFYDSDNKRLQDCQSAQIEVTTGTKVRTHLVD